MKTTSHKDTMVIYHADCMDGFCAAWVAWRKYGDQADYVPAYYGTEPPDVTGKRVFIVDFSYSYEVTMQLIQQSAELVVLDHHVTAEKELSRVPLNAFGKSRVVFDMHRSGAGIARDFFEPELQSWLVDYTQDRDLWRFALPDSEVVNAYIGTLPHTFEEYERQQSLKLEDVIVPGRGAAAYRAMYVQKTMKHARRMCIAGHPDIPVVNAPYVGISELVGALAEGHLFAVGWFQRGDGKVSFSLRSRNDVFDVSMLAQSFGGGGHRAAAGFTLDSSSPFVLEVLAGDHG